MGIIQQAINQTLGAVGGATALVGQQQSNAIAQSKEKADAVENAVSLQNASIELSKQQQELTPKLEAANKEMAGMYDKYMQHMDRYGIASEKWLQAFDTTKTEVENLQTALGQQKQQLQNQFQIIQSKKDLAEKRLKMAKVDPKSIFGGNK